MRTTGQLIYTMNFAEIGLKDIGPPDNNYRVQMEGVCDESK